MKEKNNIFKVLGIMLLAVIALTWLIPGAQFDGSGFVFDSTVTPVGIWNPITYLIGVNFALMGGIFILVVAGFYGVLNQTTVYHTMIKGIAKKFKGKEKFALIGIMLFFALLTATTGLFLALFIFIPFFISIILLMNYDRVTAVAATVGASLVGLVGGIFSYNATFAFIQGVGETDVYLNIWPRVAVLALGVIALIAYVLYYAKVNGLPKKTALKDNEDVFLTKKTGKAKQATWPMAIVLGIILLVTVLASTTTWATLEIEWFQNAFDSVMEFEVAGYPLFANILGAGAFKAFGTWQIADLILLLFIATIVIALVSKMKFWDAFNAFADSVRNLLPAALLVWLAYMVLLVTANHAFFATSFNWLFGLFDSFNFAVVGLAAFVGGSFFLEGIFSSQFVLPLALQSYGDSASMVALTTQLFSNFALLFAPTSMLLIVTLYYLNVPYTSWLKYIWKFLVILLLIMTVVLLLATFGVF